MRIAQVSPLYESVPPKFYGGTERIVHYLTEELVRQGHEVTLFASGDSRSSARLVSGCDRALRLEKVADPFALHILMAEKVLQRSLEFDVIHSHVDYLAFPVVRRRSPVPVLTTLHGRLDLPEHIPLFREYAEMPLISISDSQREPIPWANWYGTVHHGLPRDLYRHRPRAPGRYLAFLGRICPEKGVEAAISIATRAGLPLRIAAKVDPADTVYFHTRIEPLLSHPLLEFIGEIGESEKQDFLSGALALLFPIDWPEPFGLVMIEAMACGTPIIALRRGSVPELMRNGVTGFVVDNEDEALAALSALDSVGRDGCRRYFEKRFTVERMAREYLAIYKRAAAQGAPGISAAKGRAYGRRDQGRGQVLYNGHFVPGRKAKPGPETRRNLRRL